MAFVVEFLLDSFIPNKKHHQFGIKMQELCDTTGYLCKVLLYCGFKQKVPARFHHKYPSDPKSIVKALVNDLQHQGYQLTTDNWYTSLELSNQLKEIGITHIGTIKRNQAAGFPKEVVNAKLKVGEKLAYRMDDNVCVAIRDKKSQTKPLLMTSTKYSAFYVDGDGHKVKEENHVADKKYKCQLVWAYNHSKFGVDKSDEMVYSYEVERRTRRWPVKVLLRLMQKALLNSYVLHKALAEKPMKRLRFYVKVFEGLMNPARNRRIRPQYLRPDIEGKICQMEQLQGGKRKHCMVCSSRQEGKSKRTAFQCVRCQRGCCPTCFHQHFD